MTPERATSLYRRLRHLLPRDWRAAHEEDFVATLREVARADDGPGAATLVIDLLGLAVVLRARRCADGLARAGTRVGSGAAAAVLAFACLLAAPVLRWGGAIPVEFVLTTALVVAMPGIGVLYTIHCALSGGRARGLVAAMGFTLGIVPHLIVALLGLSGLMQLGATLFEAVRWAGVLYLAWVGMAMLRAGGERDGDAIDAPPTAKVREVRGPGGIVARAVLLNALNPKLTVFFFAFLPQFLDAAPSGAEAVIDPRLIALSSLFMLLTLAGFALYALVGAAAHDRIARAPRLLAAARRSLGVLLLGFAARLAAAER